MNKNEYNGWTNYETWNVALWMDNEQGAYDQWRETAKEVLEASTANQHFTREARAKLDLAAVIQEAFENDKPDLGVSTYADLLNAAMSEVNWYEIAVNLIDEIKAEVI